MLIAILSLSALTISLSAFALDAKADRHPETKSCKFWRNDCQTCAKDAKGKFHCSIIGIAYQPKQRKSFEPSGK